MTKQLYYRIMNSIKKSVDIDDGTNLSNFYKLTDREVSLSNLIFIPMKFYEGVHYDTRDMDRDESMYNTHAIISSKHVVYFLTNVNDVHVVGIILSIKPNSGVVPFLMSYTKDGEVISEPEFINLNGSGMRELTVKYSKEETVKLVKDFLSRVDKIIHTEEITGMYDHDNIIGCVYKPDYINVRHTDGYIYRLELK